jgi:hypothetical protein
LAHNILFVAIAIFKFKRKDITSWSLSYSFLS